VVSLSVYIGVMATSEENLGWYKTNYDELGSWSLRPGNKVLLGDRENRRCRFCRKQSPEVQFRKTAHAIPEALGNKSIESTYECDVCNEKFGLGIENDLGNWSKPMRTFARIRGKSGVPTLKETGSSPAWRIEYVDTGFAISSYEQDPFFEIDESNKSVAFKLKRDPYTPVAVLKAFMKIGLTLLPDEEVKNFEHLMAWVRQEDHSVPFAEQCAIIYTFQPGPMPNDLISARILRRKSKATRCPYAFLVLGYGNETFQVQLPSQAHDEATNGQAVSVYPFPSLSSPDPNKFGPPGRGQLDLTGREVVRDQIFPIVTGYEKMTRVGLERPLGD
jgi:hypothetical protein